MKPRLTASKLSSLVDGVHADGTVAGLFYRVRGTYRSWIFRRQISGKRYEIGLGGGDAELSDVRRRAAGLRALPAADFVATVTAPKEAAPKTFEQVAELFIAWSVQTGRMKEDAPHGMVEGWRLRTYAVPVLGAKDLDDITEVDVARVAEDLADRPETAKRTLLVVKQAFDWARAKGFCKMPNPADTRGALKFLLPKFESELRNHGGLPVARVPAFIADLMGRHGGGARLFVFSVLTATRSKTVRSARWEDIDLDAAEWRIPREDLKVKENGMLVVPLAQQAVRLLRAMRPKENGFVFQGPCGGAFSEGVFASIMKTMSRADPKAWLDVEQSERLGRDVRATQHGIARSCFRTWAQDDSLGNDKRFDPIVAELCLHHRIDDKYRGAYERNRFLIRRREMMEAWAEYCLSATPEDALDSMP